MKERFLLYIDILGFSDMTKSEKQKVARIYSILNSLNVHSHYAFKTIVFSDTVLVYNPELATSVDDCQYLVWYLIEFVEDLHQRLIGQNIYFRAIVTQGDFSHYKLKNVECFFGDSLIDAYYSEKDISSIGLFLNKSLIPYNKYFRTTPYNKFYEFVYLNRSVENLHQYSGDQYPISHGSVEDSYPDIPWQVRFFEEIHTHMRTHPVPKVRVKFLTAWDFYSMRYPKLLRLLEENHFSLDVIAGRVAWKNEISAMLKHIEYYGSIETSNAELSQLLNETK